MKILVLLIAVTAALGFAMTRASANVLTISGSATIQKTNYESSKFVYIGSTANLSFASKTIYNIVSNALETAPLRSFNYILPGDPPANGFIAFNPNHPVAIDTNGDTVNGLFYVTNSSGYYFPLSGTDDNGHYYSFMELDTQNTLYTFTNIVTTTNIIDSTVYITTNSIVISSTRFGWLNTNIVGRFSITNGPFNGVSVHSYNATTGAGTETDTSTALLYFHDDPYTYDDADDPDIFWSGTRDSGDDGGDDAINHNSNAFEIRGIATTTIKYNAAGVASETISLTGSGNFKYQDNYGYVVKAATVTLK